MAYEGALTVKEAIEELQKLDPAQTLEVQMSSPNGYTFAMGRVQNIFFNSTKPIVDVFVTSSEDSNLMDEEPVE